jgi:hypothetical protein
MISASTLDALSQASLSTRAGQSSASLTRRVAPPHATVASCVEVSIASTTMTRAASAVAAASLSQVPSTSNAGLFVLPQDRSCINITQEGMRERGGSQRHAHMIFSLFQTNPNQT